MKYGDLKPDMLIDGPYWDRPVTLEQFESAGQHTKLTIRRYNGTTSTIRVKLEDIDIHHTQYGTPWRTRAAVDMLRHKHAKGGGADMGGMDPLPHQIQSIRRITSQYDNIRFLLADEPGAGKTAVASSIIREMKLQGRADRTLIVTPAHLKYQWRAELKRFTGLKGYIVEGGSIDQSNPWPTDEHDILITSIDYARGEKNLQVLARMEFDLVVVDEAHHMNSSGKNVSKRYRVGEALSNISKHMLFLTATPHRGKPENFQRLLKLLNPELFPDGLSSEEVAVRKGPMFLRHLKTEMTDMDGRPIFPKRSVRSLKYEMSIPESDMYKMVSNYVRKQHQRLVEQDERQLAPFLILLIQKRMASSTYALQKTLERRRDKLKDYLERDIFPRPNLEYEEVDDEYDEDDPEHERRDDELSGISASRTPEELKVEIAELDSLVEAADQAASTKPDRKLEKLLDIVKSLGDGKLLVFSEYMDTIQYLEKHIGERVCRIDGKMKQQQRDAAVQEFRDTYRIMLATDAAREGMNMQFCNTMVNYDLPWSPIVLEQRMGRLHRYGQEKDVTIHNMIADNTIEGDVLERLDAKIKEIEKQYEAVDVIGTILSEVNIKDIMVESITGRVSDGVSKRMRYVGEKMRREQEMLERTPVDLEAALRAKGEIAAKHVDGKHLVYMMQNIFSGLGGSVKSTNTKTTIQVPSELRSGPFRRKRESFDIPVQEALSRGTKLYKHIESWVMDNCRADLQGGSVFAGNYEGHIVFHITKLKDSSGKTAEVLVQAHRVGADGVVQSVHPDILSELDDMGGDPGARPEVGSATDRAFEDAQARSRQLNEEAREYWRHRSETMNIGGGLESLRMELGDLMPGTPEWKAIDEKIKNLESWEGNMQRSASTDKLHVEEPVLVGWVRVVRRKDTQDTEIRGMNRSMEIERKEGFIPEDVSNKRGLGYDILSKHPDGRERHIEVKARCSFTPVQLTPNEENARLKDPNYKLHVHVIDGDTHYTTILDDPSKLITKKNTTHDAPISELNRLGEVYEY